jgi:hypothetical protein
MTSGLQEDSRKRVQLTLSAILRVPTAFCLSRKAVQELCKPVRMAQRHSLTVAMHARCILARSQICQIEASGCEMHA